MANANLEYLRTYYQKNKEYFQLYHKTEEGVKRNRINNWKQIGVDPSYDFDVIYDIYIHTSKCDLCNVNLTDGKGLQGRCLDHNHKTGEIRNIVCMKCNYHVERALAFS